MRYFRVLITSCSLFSTLIEGAGLSPHAAFGRSFRCSRKPKLIVLLLFSLLQLSTQISFGQQSEIIVGPNVRVSKARGDLEHNEVLLAADPSDPTRLLGCSMGFSSQLNKLISLAYVSIDGGKSWEFAVSNDTGILSGDPSCTFGTRDSAYFSAIERNETGSQELMVYRSRDGGKTWSPPVKMLGSAPLVDRPYVIVDHSGGRYQRRVYVHGQIQQQTVDGENIGRSIALWRSLDGGATYEGPIVRSGVRPNVFHLANSVVLSDGTLVCLIAELDLQKRNDAYGRQYRKADLQNGILKIIISDDGGESLSPAVKVADMFADWRSGASTIPSLAADHGISEFKDRLYAVWADGRYGRTQILISYSPDKGRTWSKPQLVSDDQPTMGDGPDNFMPVVATNVNGVVGVMWYDRREIHDNFGYYVRFAASLDGGDTWLPSVRVSEAPKTLDRKEGWPVRARVLRGGSGLFSIILSKYEWVSGGHTAGLAADSNGVFHPFWVDNRTGVSQIWTAPVVVSGAVTRNGSADLARLEDISGSVSVELTNCGYEGAKKLVSCNARLKNTSKETFGRPLVLRVLALRSELGESKIANADNLQTGAGAVWDFTKQLKAESLEPNETSDIRQLRFQISNPRPIRQGNYFKFSLVEIEARVLGHKKKAAQ